MNVQVEKAIEETIMEDHNELRSEKESWGLCEELSLKFEFECDHI